MKLRSAALGTTALVILLSAGAAQSLSGSSTVYTDDIVDHNITAADLGTNSVTRSALGDNAVGTNEVANGSLTGADLKDGSLALTKLSTQPVTGFVERYGEMTHMASGRDGQTVNCPSAGQTAIAGEWSQSDDWSDPVLAGSQRTNTSPDGWSFLFKFSTTPPANARIILAVLCASH